MIIPQKSRALFALVLAGLAVAPSNLLAQPTAPAAAGAPADTPAVNAAATPAAAPAAPAGGGGRRGGPPPPPVGLGPLPEVYASLPNTPPRLLGKTPQAVAAAVAVRRLHQSISGRCRRFTRPSQTRFPACWENP